MIPSGLNLSHALLRNYALYAIVLHIITSMESIIPVIPKRLEKLPVIKSSGAHVKSAKSPLQMTIDLIKK